jgi:hypothetical protein
LRGGALGGGGGKICNDEQLGLAGLGRCSRFVMNYRRGGG